MHHQDVGFDREQRDRRDVTHEAEFEIWIKRRIDEICPRGEQERYPSGGEFTTASVAILVPAPARFSTMNWWPSRSDSHCPISLARLSVDPPGAKPTISAPAVPDKPGPKQRGRDGKVAAPVANAEKFGGKFHGVTPLRCQQPGLALVARTMPDHVPVRSGQGILTAEPIILEGLGCD